MQVFHKARSCRIARGQYEGNYGTSKIYVLIRIQDNGTNADKVPTRPVKQYLI